MDKKAEGKGRWDWLPAEMPGVARLVKEKRAQLGNEHVARCWDEGVVQKKPGWLFAREGALSIGTPPEGDADLLALAFGRHFDTQAFLFIREPEVASHGKD